MTLNSANQGNFVVPGRIIVFAGGGDDTIKVAKAYVGTKSVWVTAPALILGEGGNDKLYGGADGDALAGGDNDDQLFGDAGNDQSFDGGAGVDRCDGGAGAENPATVAGCETVLNIP